MRKIIIFQHVGHEPLGTLNPMLKAAGFRIRYVNFGRDASAEPSLDSYNGLIVLGGPMGVYELEQHPHLKFEMRAIEEALKRGIPVLGICLGAQLIAHVLGAPVRKAPAWEIGWYELNILAAGKKDPLFAQYEAKERVFQLHQDMFDPPSGCEHLASTEMCPGQAFRYGEKVYGLQFHLEADRPMILRWLHRPENRALVENSGGQFTEAKLESDTSAHIARSLELSTHTFGKFIEIFQLPERPELVGSAHGKPKKAGQ